MSIQQGRFIGGKHHGEPFDVPFGSEHIAIINTESKYSSFLTVPPHMEDPRTYLVSTELLDESANLSDRALAFIQENDLWEWGAP